MEQLELSLLVGMNNNRETLENKWAFSYKINTYPYSPAITLPASHQREIKIHTHTKICTQIFMTTLLIIA